MFSKFFASSLASSRHHLAATLSPPFPRIILLRLSLLSTSTGCGHHRPTGYPEAENTCTMSEFLLNECGLSQSEVSTILKIWPPFLVRRSTDVPQQVVRFLRDSGFTEQQVRQIITRNPGILNLKADQRLKPKIELMKKLGVTAQDLGNVIAGSPRLFNCSIGKTLYPNILYLQNLFRSEADVSRVFKRAPQILTCSNGSEIFEKRLKHLTSFGLLEDEIKEFVRKTPLVLSVPTDKVQKIMDFFIHTGGLPARFILSHPLHLTYSLECRIKPRHKVYMSISAMQPSKRLPSLISAIRLTERQFLEKYVECSPHAPKLLEIYRDRAVDLDIIQ